MTSDGLGVMFEGDVEVNISLYCDNKPTVKYQNSPPNFPPPSELYTLDTLNTLDTLDTLDEFNTLGTLIQSFSSLFLERPSSLTILLVHRVYRGSQGGSN